MVVSRVIALIKLPLVKLLLVLSNLVIDWNIWHRFCNLIYACSHGLIILTLRIVILLLIIFILPLIIIYFLIGLLWKVWICFICDLAYRILVNILILIILVIGELIMVALLHRVVYLSIVLQSLEHALLIG